jgi:protein-tyrosine-phosphatase
MPSRILFLCARTSARAMIAGSILAARAADTWDVWSTPTSDLLGQRLASEVLQERGIPLLPSDHLTSALFNLSWNEGIVLCSGNTST